MAGNFSLHSERFPALGDDATHHFIRRFLAVMVVCRNAKTGISEGLRDGRSNGS
jgi:hypothetical protein